MSTNTRVITPSYFIQNVIQILRLHFEFISRPLRIKLLDPKTYFMYQHEKRNRKMKMPHFTLK
jgi:hypothetical protein